jgi:hypothetical protein
MVEDLIIILGMEHLVDKSFHWESREIVIHSDETGIIMEAEMLVTF